MSLNKKIGRILRFIEKIVWIHINSWILKGLQGISPVEDFFQQILMVSPVEDFGVTPM